MDESLYVEKELENEYGIISEWEDPSIGEDEQLKRFLKRKIQNWKNS